MPSNRKGYFQKYYEKNKMKLTAIPCSWKTRELLREIKEESEALTYDDLLLMLIELYEENPYVRARRDLKELKKDAKKLKYGRAY